jgi:hypothetical protein
MEAKGLAVYIPSKTIRYIHPCRGLASAECVYISTLLLIKRGKIMIDWFVEKVAAQLLAWNRLASEERIKELVREEWLVRVRDYQAPQYIRGAVANQLEDLLYTESHLSRITTAVTSRINSNQIRKSDD